MSGRKSSFISMTDEQYQELHDAFLKRLFFSEPENSQPQQGKMQFQEQIKESQSTIHQRQDLFRDLVSDFNQQVQEIESQTLASLEKSYDHLAEDLSQKNQTLENDLVEYVDHHFQEYNQQILENHHQQQNQMIRLRRQVVSMMQDNQARAQLAEEWVNNTQNLIYFIQDHYKTEQFAPTRLDQLFEDLQLAAQNFEMGLFEACLVSSQNIYRKASELRLILEREEAQWNTVLSVARKKISDLLAHFESQKEMVYQPDNAAETYTFLPNYWTNGKYEKLISQAVLYQKNLNEKPETLSTQDIRQYLSEVFPHLEEEMESTLKEALDNLIKSQIRTNIADLVMRALQQQGYQLDQSQYQNNDSRNGFGFIAKNFAGNAIKVFVNPGPAEKNEIELESLDQRPQTEYFLKRRASEIGQALQKFGLTVGEFIQKNTSYPQPQHSNQFSVAEKKPQYVTH